MEKEFMTIPETELQQFENEMRNASILDKTAKVDKINLVLLYKLFQAERRIVRLEKHITTPLIH